MRSIRVRLALIFFAITLTAIAGIYLYVAPQLESRPARREARRRSPATPTLYSRDLIARDRHQRRRGGASTGPCARPPTGPARA